MKLRHPIFALFLTVLFLFSAKGQTLDEAKQWYEQGKFSQAKPILEAEYASNPKNTAINLSLGVIALSESNLLKAQKHLESVARQKAPDASLYLGELYAKMYRFADAEKEFTKYERANRRKKDALAKLSDKRAEADRIKKMLNRTEDIRIIDSTVVGKADLLSAIAIGKSAGELITVKADTSGQTFVRFVNEKKTETYYSKPHELSGQKIYSMEKLLDNFGNEKILPEAINQSGNQAYPFVMPDGLTLYFASTGHNSIGGYDLFVTRRNLKSNNYLTPSQLNMPFNSPANDYMMAIDEEKGLGWFASDRFQPEDSVCIYTFIPATTVTLLETDDEKLLIRRARITAIRDSWKPEADYSDLLQKAGLKQEKQTKSNDFQFVINNRITYFSLSDFKDSQARNTFAGVITLEKELLQAQKTLDAQRNQLAESTEKNPTLENSIRTLEKRTDELFREIENRKTEARNQEIRTHYL